MDYIDVNRKISARQASFCTGLSYETLKADIEKGRLKAKRNNKGKSSSNESRILRKFRIMANSRFLR